MDKKECARAVGHIPSGLFIIAAKHGDSEVIDGFLASWVQQVSFEPLLISLCLIPGRPAYDAVKSGALFTLNVVGDHDASFMKHFWSGYNPEQNVFDEIDHEITPEGAVLMKQARSSLVCRMKESLEPGDHEIIVAEVLESHVHNEDAQSKIHIRKSGLEY